jgi:hypothetical protein
MRNSWRAKARKERQKPHRRPHVCLHDRYAVLRREVKAEIAALHKDVLEIKKHLGLTSGTARHKSR